MNLISSFPPIPKPGQPVVATIGFFDGVHGGHRFLIRQVMSVALKNNMNSMLVTFNVHPRKVMQTDFQPNLLTTTEEKISLLATMGVDYCALLPFTRQLSDLTARDFMEKVLFNQLNVRTLIVGYDHHFGHNRTDSFEDYCRYGRELGMEVLRADAFVKEGQNISSSLIRRLLNEGEIARASRCLGYNYFMDGHVISGQQIGRKIGFPTANFQVNESDKLIPADGVYAVKVHVDNNVYSAMLNIGFRPTIGENSVRTIEAHLLHFEGNLYDSSLRIEFIERIRGEKKFDSWEELADQIKKDATLAESLLDN